MLHTLFGSKARVKILKLFLSHPHEKFYIRQISRDLKLQLNSVRRELENLEKFGLLISNPDPSVINKDEEVTSREDFIKAVSKSQNKKTPKELNSKIDRKYYQVNKNFILYDEIKSLIIKAQILYEKDFVQKLHKTGSPKLLILTGFFVNDFDKGVDLLVVGRLNKRKFSRVIKDLENELGREINYSLMAIQEFKYRRDITDIFLYDILEGNRLTIIDEFGVS